LLDHIPQMIVARDGDRVFDEADLSEQIGERVRVFGAIESFLMAYCDEGGEAELLRDAEAIALGTLAHHLSDDPTQAEICQLFRILALSVAKGLPDPRTRRVLSRTFLGVSDALQLAEWTNQNASELADCRTLSELSALLWPVLMDHVRNKAFRDCQPPDALRRVVQAWIDGLSFDHLLQILRDADARFGTGPRPRKAKLHHVVDVCEHGLGFDGTLVVGAVAELLELESVESDGVVRQLQHLQKALKYGLQSPTAILLHELGFADRCLANDLLDLIGECGSAAETIARVKEAHAKVGEVLRMYPSYFTDVMSHIG
jgi:hypothetical protein